MFAQFPGDTISSVTLMDGSVDPYRVDPGSVVVSEGWVSFTTGNGMNAVSAPLTSVVAFHWGI